MPEMLASMPEIKSGPTRIATPTTPMITPARRCSSGRSPAKAQASSTAQIGVVALSTDARPLAISRCPSAMSENGIRLLRNAMTTNGNHREKVAGNRWPLNNTIGSRTVAARPTRAATRVSVGSSVTAMPTNMNEPPHRSDKLASQSHCESGMWYQIPSGQRAEAYSVRKGTPRPKTGLLE